MNKRITTLLSALLLSACQTHLPIVSEDTDSTDNTSKPCESSIEQMQLADIDYLLYANRMVDSMIQDKAIQQKVSTARLKIFIEAVKHEYNSSGVNMANVNNAISNRILRSGQFIPVNDQQQADVHLSGVFEKKQKMHNHCVENYEQFSMRLIDSQSKKLLWSEQKQFK